ncbi:MAG: cytochrome c biogenesis protein CcsA [Bacteroidetes bacterium]|nr:cytochrome c biogenesis protein CcsA [Bacteroidota bacterium]MBS1973662.1 cytochrome c biogenesis protein CcsA [Bacteroidota bacterium]
MDYFGEHLLPGKIGHFFVTLSFAASFVATIAYYKSASAKNIEDGNAWKKLARAAFAIDCFSVFSIFAVVYYIISHHYFEYNYAWEHSNRTLPGQYLLACIWEAQEGSFLLWTIWQCALGLVLMFKAKKWEAPVMTVISFGQLCLATMILGIYISNAKIGINPFLLVRQMPAFSDAPIFNQANYLSIPQMQDGQGFNALLQNYWVVIHPPVLFLGFAATIVPFAYAFAGLWKKDFGAWTKPALPWTLFAACVLGTGVMMGAAWAYEALSFGGFWAWDPVENASLVPWLVLVAALHTQVVYNSTGHSLRATYFFVIMSFVLVLYATFLTRSGILGDSSVHAFVDSGMNLQLILFIVVFLAPAFYLFIKNYKKIPHIEKEESAYSREFWMFIGSLVLFLSSLFVITATSLPVINKIFNTNWSVGADNTFAYNRVEIFIAIILGLLTAFTQYLKYKDTNRKTFLKKMALPTLIATVLSLLVSIFGGIHYNKYGPGFQTAIHLALFGAFYAVVANAGYIWTGMNGKIKAAGASVAHVGFGLMLVGILLSTSKKELLSYNTTGINLPFDPKDADKNPLENITLLKGIKTDMGKYWATYTGEDSTNASGNISYYHVVLNEKKTDKRFDLYPDLIRNTKGMAGVSQNPDKHHYWDRDIYSYINYASNLEKGSDTTQFKYHLLSGKDTIFYSNGYMTLHKTVKNPNNEKYHFIDADTAVMADIEIVSRDSMRYTAKPLLYIKNNELKTIPDTVFAQDLVVIFKGIKNNSPEIGIKESSALTPFVSLKVYEFPYINILWIGTIIMIAGFAMSIFRRSKRQAAA